MLWLQKMRTFLLAHTQSLLTIDIDIDRDIESYRNSGRYWWKYVHTSPVMSYAYPGCFFMIFPFSSQNGEVNFKHGLKESDSLMMCMISKYYSRSTKFENSFLKKKLGGIRGVYPQFQTRQKSHIKLQNFRSHIKSSISPKWGFSKRGLMTSSICR